MSSSSDDDDEVVDDVEQERRWYFTSSSPSSSLPNSRWRRKVEAIVVRIMKARLTVTRPELMAGVYEAWRALGRTDAINDDYVAARVAFLVKREWFIVLPDGRLHFEAPQGE